MEQLVIDAHIHLFPSDLPERWEWYAQRDLWFRLLTEETPDSRVREVWSTPEQTLEAADEAGIDLLVMQGWYWNDMDLCRRHNDFMAQVLERWPNRFRAFASINPVFGKESLRELERCRSMGFSGVGELGPGGNGYGLDDPRLYDLLEAAESMDMPVNFHAGEPVGHRYAGKDTTPISGFYALAERYPRLNMILAHLGGGMPFYELMPEGKRVLKNVSYDLAANPLLYSIRSVRAAAELAGADKILFGTDFPLTIYPRKTKERNLSLFADAVRQESGLSGEALTQVMGGNAARLLKL